MDSHPRNHRTSGTFTEPLRIEMARMRLPCGRDHRRPRKEELQTAADDT